MPDDVTAYAPAEPSLSDYDHELQEYNYLCNRARRRDQMPRLTISSATDTTPRHGANAAGIVETVRQITAIMKKEASAIRDLGSFPEQKQVQLWHLEFIPLFGQEHALRERLLRRERESLSET